MEKVLEDTSISKLSLDKITGRIITFEDALLVDKKITEDVKNLIKYNGTDEEMLSIVSYTKLIIIARALNEGWEPNWQDSTERKWYPYFSLASGFAFSNSIFDWTGTFSRSSSRLCFKTEELARYAGTQFIELYKEYITIQNKNNR